MAFSTAAEYGGSRTAMSNVIDLDRHDAEGYSRGPSHLPLVYKGYTLRKQKLPSSETPTWRRTTKTPMGITSVELEKKVKKARLRKPIADRIRELKENQHNTVNELIKQHIMEDNDPRTTWNLVFLEKDMLNRKETLALHVILHRELNKEFKGDLYDSRFFQYSPPYDRGYPQDNSNGYGYPPYPQAPYNQNYQQPHQSNGGNNYGSNNYGGGDDVNRLLNEDVLDMGFVETTQANTSKRKDSKSSKTKSKSHEDDILAMLENDLKYKTKTKKSGDKKKSGSKSKKSHPNRGPDEDSDSTTDDDDLFYCTTLTDGSGPRTPRHGRSVRRGSHGSAMHPYHACVDKPCYYAEPRIHHHSHADDYHYTPHHARPIMSPREVHPIGYDFDNTHDAYYTTTAPAIHSPFTTHYSTPNALSHTLPAIRPLQRSVPETYSEYYDSGLPTAPMVPLTRGWSQPPPQRRYSTNVFEPHSDLYSDVDEPFARRASYGPGGRSAEYWRREL